MRDKQNSKVLWCFLKTSSDSAEQIWQGRRFQRAQGMCVKCPVPSSRMHLWNCRECTVWTRAKIVQETLLFLFSKMFHMLALLNSDINFPRLKSPLKLPVWKKINKYKIAGNLFGEIRYHLGEVRIIRWKCQFWWWSIPRCSMYTHGSYLSLSTS